MKQRIIVFGTGRYFERKKANVMEKYEVVGFIDNAVKTGQHEIKEQLKVYHPSELNKFSDDTMILLMSVKFIEMWKQLIDLGVEEERILFGVKIEPYHDEIEKLFHSEAMEVCSQNRKICIRINDLSEQQLENEEEYKHLLRELYRKKFPCIDAIAQMPLTPLSKRFGLERGKAIDRVYIENFLEQYKQCIHGDVMEVADNKYTKRFGETRVNNAYALHVNGWGDGVIKGNLATGEGIEEGMVDCFICTQTILCIYDIHSCVKNIYKMLRPGGYALITSSFIAQLSMYDYENWGEYWRITELSLRKLLEECFEPENIEVFSYGNVKTAMSFLYGLCAEDLKKEDFEYNDEQYALIVAAVVKKEQG